MTDPGILWLKRQLESMYATGISSFDFTPTMPRFTLSRHPELSVVSTSPADLPAAQTRFVHVPSSFPGWPVLWHCRYCCLWSIS